MNRFRVTADGNPFAESPFSRVGPGRTQLALMFPRPPSIIPYGGFAPVRLEAPPSTGNPSASRRLIPVQHPHVRPTLCPGVTIPWRGHHLTVVGRRAAGGTHRPLAQPGLSCPGLRSLLRPDAPVSGTPAGSLPWRAVPVTFPSLPWHTVHTCHDPYPAGHADFIGWLLHQRWEPSSFRRGLGNRIFPPLSGFRWVR